MDDPSIPPVPDTPSGSPIPPSSAAPASAPAPSTGLSPNAAGALSYVLGALTGILFLVLEKRDPFVRFHAAQSIGMTIAVMVLAILVMIVGGVLGAIPLVGWIVGLLLSLGFSVAAFLFWIFLMYQAWQGRSWEVPFVGRQVRSMLAEGGNGA